MTVFSDIEPIAARLIDQGDIRYVFHVRWFEVRDVWGDTEPADKGLNYALQCLWDAERILVGEDGSVMWR